MENFHTKKITSLFIKSQNIRQSSYRRFFVLYPTKFTEPGANNCFSIIALVLSNSFANSFWCWNHSVTIVLITRAEIRIKQVYVSQSPKKSYLTLKSVTPNLALQNTVFIRLNVGAIIKFFVIRVRRLFKGGVYLNPNNGRLTDHFNF